jgi:hypothetical protein
MKESDGDTGSVSVVLKFSMLQWDTRCIGEQACRQHWLGNVLLQPQDTKVFCWYIIEVYCARNHLWVYDRQRLHVECENIYNMHWTGGYCWIKTILNHLYESFPLAKTVLQAPCAVIVHLSILCAREVNLPHPGPKVKNLQKNLFLHIFFPTFKTS